MKRELMVTGLGAVTPLGTGTETVWAALRRGQYGLSELDLFDMAGFRYTKGGQLRDARIWKNARDLDPHLDRLVAFATQAGVEALGERNDRKSIGLILASNFGETWRTEELIAQAEGFKENAPALLRQSTPNAAIDAIRTRLGLGGPTAGVSLSCSSGTAAIALGADWLSSGVVDHVLVVGADVISRLAWSGLVALRTMTKSLLTPFDINRSGTLFSEGAAALLLSGGRANGQGDAIGRLLGWATNNNAHHLTAPAPAGEGSAKVMRAALARADVSPEAVTHINAHGTGTRHNDVTESQAIRTVFGDATEGMAVTSIKSMLGHMLGAAGTMEAVATVCALRDQVVSPTINVAEQDPECNVPVVLDEEKAVDIDVALSNSAGIGGCNAAVVFGKVS